MKFLSLTKNHFIGLLIFILILQPAISVGQNEDDYTTNYTNIDGKSTIKVSKNGNDFKVEYEGDISLSPDETDIVKISDGGFIEISKSSFGNTRRILIESDRNGNLIRKYFVGRSEKDYQSEGRQWLTEILPELLRTTTIAAESRVNRFYNQGGVSAVLDEVKKMESDHVETAYLKLLLKKDTNSNDILSILNTAEKQIRSDHYLADILKTNQTIFLKDDKTIEAYIDACKTIQSDHYVVSVLREVIDNSSITDSRLEELLSISNSISSDHYLAEVLRRIMDKRSLTEQNINEILKLSKKIESDHYKTEILRKVIHSKSLSSSAYSSLLQILEDVESDHYSTNVITQLLDKDFEPTNYNLDSMLQLINNKVKSDHYASVVYRKLAKKNLSEKQLISALTASKNIKSDHYLHDTLLSFSNKVENSSEAVKSAYRSAAKSISSETYYGKVLKAID